MLKALHITNFKAFAETQRVPLRPITLIFGANSAGKSSIIHALALAHHAMETGELAVQKTRIGGESIDLGGFHQYVHGRNPDLEVGFGFEIDPRRLAESAGGILAETSKIEVEVGTGLRSYAQHMRRTIQSEVSEELAETRVKRLISSAAGFFSRVERYSISVDDLHLLTMSARYRLGAVELQLDHVNTDHPLLERWFRGVVATATTTAGFREEDLETFQTVLEELVPSVRARVEGLFPRIEASSVLGEGGGSDDAVLIPVSKGHREEGIARGVRIFFPRMLRNLLAMIGESLETNLRRLSYLGPLRSYPPRHLMYSEDQDPNWFAGGGYAWDVVRTDDGVRKRVNDWLGDESRLKTPYELVVRELVSLDDLWNVVPTKLERGIHDVVVRVLEMFGGGFNADLQPLADELAEGGQLEDALQYGNPEVEDLVTELADGEDLLARFMEAVEYQSGEFLKDLVLVDKRSGTTVSHRDVGIGVSQVLPVLVSAYGSRERLVAIEQPEIHLHPALQAELGDVFLESALGPNKNTFLIETHSEHLLLRIMRRMRETCDGELPDGLPEVRPEDVMVLFVEPDGPRSIVREMPLNERGELVKAWPGGFFEESLREIF